MTDSITRQIAKKWGAEATVSELISAEGLIRDSGKTKMLLEFEQSERPIGIQIFGAEAGQMAKAAVIVSELKPDFIDLNFGCPVKKVIKRNGGSSLLKNLTELEKIIRQVTQAVDIPVTVKYRSGWDSNSIVAVEVARIAEDNGIAAVCLHPRTRVQGFSGQADWSLIKAVKQAVKIPVIGSGDIDSPPKAKRMFDETGCDAVMIGRASFGNPWIFRSVKHYLNTGEILLDPGIDTRIDTAIEHLRLSIKKFGSPAGLFRMRSQLCRYLKGIPGASGVRSKMVLMPSERDVIELLEEFKRYSKYKDYGTKEYSENSPGCQIRQTGS